MNAQGWIRGYMSKSYSSEQFMKQVVETIGRQLNLWNDAYETELLQEVLRGRSY